MGITMHEAHDRAERAVMSEPVFMERFRDAYLSRFEWAMIERISGESVEQTREEISGAQESVFQCPFPKDVQERLYEEFHSDIWQVLTEEGAPENRTPLDLISDRCKHLSIRSHTQFISAALYVALVSILDSVAESLDEWVISSVDAETGRVLAADYSED